jgi:type IV pilus assembly protein PilF
MPSARAFFRYATCIVLLTMPFAYGQSTGQTGGTTGSSTKSVPITPPRPTTPTIQEERRLVFLSGRVMLDDGTEPQDRASIERVCNGRVRREAYTDSHGHFGFQLGAEMRGFQDATVGGGPDAMRSSSVFGNPQASGSPQGMAIQGVTQRELMGCELRANLPGFRSDFISLAGRQLLDSSSVGTIVLHRLGKVEGTSISATSLKAPRDAKKALERGQNFLKKGNKEEAAGQFSKAIELYPAYAEARVRLGDIYAEMGRREEAEKLYQQAIEADPHFMLPYFGLAVLAAREKDWKAVAELSGRALALNAYEYPVAYLFDAAANYNLHNYDRAEKSARAGQRLDSQHRLPRIDFILANLLMQRGDYAGAAEQLRSFLNHAPPGPESDEARQMLAGTESRLAAATPAAATPANSAVATPK